MADSYGKNVNTALLEFIGQLRGTVLDLGCGQGVWAPQLRALGAQRLIGVEPSGDALIASDRYDELITEPIEEVALPPVDVVIAADVLEHLADPWAVLAKLRAATVDGGQIFVSVPNAQFIKALLTLARGRFPYEDGGYWDRTHLHWFTAKSMEGSLVNSGWQAERTGFAVGLGARGRAHRIAPAAGPLLAHQLHVAARAV